MKAIGKGRRIELVLLAAVMLWAAVVRLAWFHSSPPGLYSDEASNVWNAWTLLHTGRDEWGARWPIFYTRAFDDYRSPIYIYALLPFQAIGGMNPYTTRLPAIIGGVITVWLVYFIGRRMFNGPVGLIAAAALAMMPWHIQHTRWGHEGTLTPLLFAGAIAVLLWADLPFCDTPRQRSGSVWRALLAGLFAGLALYGYPAIRLVLPSTLLLGSVAAWPAIRGLLNHRAGRRLFLCCALGGVAIAAPLVVKHVTDPLINTRARHIRLWTDDDTISQRLGKVAARYVEHFGPEFLFVRGTSNPSFAPPHGFGELHWYMLPLLVLGIGAAVLRSRKSISSRMLLVMLVCYPLGDVLFGETVGPHPLRSFAGVVPLGIAIGLGAAAATRWLAARSRQVALGFVATFAISAVWAHVEFLRDFFGPYNLDPVTRWIHNTDIVDACDWLRPNLNDFDAVFFTTDAVIHPYAVTLVQLQHSPSAWFNEQRDYVTAPPPFIGQICSRYTKVRFIYDRNAAERELAELQRRGRPTRVAMVLRPRESALAGGRRPDHVIFLAGRPWLLIYDFSL